MSGSSDVIEVPLADGPNPGPIQSYETPEQNATDGELILAGIIGKYPGPIIREEDKFEGAGDERGAKRRPESGGTTMSDGAGGSERSRKPPTVHDDGTISLWGVGPKCPRCGGPTHAVTAKAASRPWWCKECNIRLDDDGNR